MACGGSCWSSTSTARRCSRCARAIGPTSRTRGRVTEVFAHALGRLHAERAMRESEARFRLLADSAPLMIWMSLPNGQRTYFNERWLQLTGSRSPEVFGDGWLAGVHADDRDATIKA